MARTKDEAAAQAFGDALTDLRKMHPMSDSDFERAVIKEMGDAAPNKETLRQYHHGKTDPASVSIDVACAIAKVYDVSVSALHPSFGVRLALSQPLVASAKIVSRGSTRRQHHLVDAA